MGISVNIKAVFVQKFLRIIFNYWAKALLLMKLSKLSKNRCQVSRLNWEIQQLNRGYSKQPAIQN
jgi:hypothetical protein